MDLPCDISFSSWFPGEPERMKRFKTRITSPVIPGQTLTTRMWQVGEKEIRFQLVDSNANETEQTALELWHMRMGLGLGEILCGSILKLWQIRLLLQR